MDHCGLLAAFEIDRRAPSPPSASPSPPARLAVARVDLPYLRSHKRPGVSLVCYLSIVAGASKSSALPLRQGSTNTRTVIEGSKGNHSKGIDRSIVAMNAHLGSPKVYTHRRYGYEPYDDILDEIEDP